MRVHTRVLRLLTHERRASFTKPLQVRRVTAFLPGMELRDSARPHHDDDGIALPFFGLSLWCPGSLGRCLGSGGDTQSGMDFLPSAHGQI